MAVRRWSGTRELVATRVGIGERKYLIALFVSALAIVRVFAGCTRQQAGVVKRADDVNLPIRQTSSADFGYVRASGGSVSRIVKISNSGRSAVTISRWTTSCECVAIASAPIHMAANEVAFIELAFNPRKEGAEFVGDLLLSVEAFSDRELVGRFSVPVSIILDQDVERVHVQREQK